jgi:hypothetical protein
LDRLAHAGDLVRGKVIHDDDVSRAAGRRQDLLDLDPEDRTGHRSGDHERCEDVGATPAGEEGGGAPVSLGHLVE